MLSITDLPLVVDFCAGILVPVHMGEEARANISYSHIRGAMQCHAQMTSPVCCLRSPKFCPSDCSIWHSALPDCSGLNELSHIGFFLHMTLIYCQCTPLCVSAFCDGIMVVCGSSYFCQILWDLSRMQVQQKSCARAEPTISAVVLMFNLPHPFAGSPV